MMERVFHQTHLEVDPQMLTPQDTRATLVVAAEEVADLTVPPTRSPLEGQVEDDTESIRGRCLIRQQLETSIRLAAEVLREHLVLLLPLRPQLEPDTAEAGRILQPPPRLVVPGLRLAVVAEAEMHVAQAADLVERVELERLDRFKFGLSVVRK